MRRALTAAVVLVAALSVLGGCGGGRPPGVDGNLTDDWSAFAPPEVPTPPEHACYRSNSPNAATLGAFEPVVDCLGATVETIHVGLFSGADAGSDHLPAADSAGMRAAYDDCNHRAGEFLGGDWRTSQIFLFVTPPLPRYWEGGARWYRCDLAAFADPELTRPVVLTDSLRGGLHRSGITTRGCVNVVLKGDDVDHIEAVVCEQPHSGEFTGIFDAPDGPVPAAGSKPALRDGCAKVTGAFVGVDPGSVQNRAGYLFWTFGPTAWQQGNRGVQCYLWFDDKPVTGSKRGVGAKGLPYL